MRIPSLQPQYVPLGQVLLAEALVQDNVRYLLEVVDVRPGQLVVLDNTVMDSVSGQAQTLFCETESTAYLIRTSRSFT